jgi:hypothetical protein
VFFGGVGKLTVNVIWKYKGCEKIEMNFVKNKVAEQTLFQDSTESYSNQVCYWHWNRKTECINGT